MLSNGIFVSTKTCQTQGGRLSQLASRLPVTASRPRLFPLHDPLAKPNSAIVSAFSNIVYFNRIAGSQSNYPCQSVVIFSFPALGGFRPWIVSLGSAPAGC